MRGSNQFDQSGSCGSRFFLRQYMVRYLHRFYRVASECYSDLKHTLIPVLSLAVIVIPAFTCMASGKLVIRKNPHHSTLQIAEENDSMAGSDRYYTQGIKMAYMYAESHQEGLDDSAFNLFTLPHHRTEEEVFGAVMSQHIYTPGVLTTVSLIEEDRPYAGLLYAGAVYQKKGRDRAGNAMQDHYQLSLGLIGPLSFAEDIQKWAHGLSNSRKPQGWVNQLENEPAMALQFERTYRFSWPLNAGSWRTDLLPHLGFSLGNIDTSARTGVLVRLGRDIPQDFGTGLIHSISTNSGETNLDFERDKKWGFYFMGRAGARVVGYNAFLDGNLFSHSHSVDKETFVPHLGFGMMFVNHRLEMGYQHNLTGPEFLNQKAWHHYGSIAMTLHF